MKKYIILILISLWAFVDAKAQSNYFISSVGEVEITETGSGLLSGQTKKDTSEVATSQRFWFLSPKGVDPSTGNWFQAGLLNVELKNLSSTQWKSVTLYDFTGTNILYTENIAPNASIYFDADNNKRLDASKDYYWKFEDITLQSVVCNNDTKTISASNFGYIDVLDNDKNIPAGSECRLKAGQTLTGGITVTKDQFAGLKVSTSSQQGSFSFVYEVVLNGTVLGEATATVTVGNASQYCTLAILSEQLQVGSQTIHEFTLYSLNAQINPFNYTVRTGSFTGTIVKSGTTPPATSNKEIIDFGTLPTGTYYVTFSSTVSTCFDLRVVSHIALNDACNTSIISVDKLNGTNNYSVNSSFSNVTSIKAYLTNAEISVSVPLLSQTNITTPAFNLNLTTLQTGVYYLNIEGEGKFCKAQKVFEHTLVEVTNGAKLETWTKFIHNYKDNWIISGKNDYESGRDKFGLQTFSEKAQNVVWKTFISDFENLGNSPRAKAIIGFRKDTTRNEVGISVAVTPNSIILQQRLTKSGTTNVLATVNNITMPVWVRLTKTGNDLVADFSKDLSMTPVYQELGRVNGVFSGWSNYQKYIGVASAKTDVIATARFQGQLGGKVNFASSTISIAPPVIASNIINPTSGQSVTLSTSTACIAPSTNRWYKNSETASFSAGSTVNVQAYHTDSYYARCENGLNKSVKSNAVLFTISNLVSCNNGTQPFAVVTAVYSGGNVSFSFNGSLSNANWSVLNGSTVVKTGTAQPTASTMTVPSGNLSAGNYIFKLDGISCSGSAQKAFAVAGASSAPMVTSVPVSPVAGDNITMTATGCVGNYNWYVSGASQAYATNAGSSTVNSVAGGTYYYATCIGSNVPSNYVNIGAVITEGGGAGQVTFVNPTKNVPVETQNAKYSPHLFPTVNVVNSIDPVLGKNYPNWAVAWQAEGSNFSANNRKTPNLGIPFMYDQFQGIYGGYGTRCVDYLSFFFPNTSDPTCLKPNGQPFQYTEFTSAIPFEQKAWATYGQANSTIFNNYTLQQAFDEGANAGNAIQYGWGDKVNGKVNVGLANADIETGHELGQDGTNKHLAFLQGMANNSQGYVFSQYSAPMNIVYIDPSNYPLTNTPSSSYPQFRLNPDGTNRGSGSPQANTVPFSNDWNGLNILSLTGKSILDYKNALPTAELSSYADATFKQGETFVFNNTGSTRVVNKFYPTPNTNHVVAAVIHAGETNKWFVRNKLDNRKVFLQSKITCDRGDIGLSEFNEYGFNLTNNALRGKQFDREYGFDIGAFTAFTGCEWSVWDRNYENHNLDGYNGVFGIINVLYQRKTFGSTSVSFVDLKPRANFLLWESEISYNNGSTYVKDKAQDYLLDRTKIPQRQFITPDGYWGGFLARPENTENTSCILRVTFNGQNYTHTVTSNDWETVDYNFRNTPLSSLPNDKKDYYYFLVKLTNGATSEAGVINAPTITKNVANPTAGQSVMLTSSSCQSASYTTKWYDSAEGNLLATSLTYTVNAQNGNGYYAKCVGTEGSSLSSNVITFSIANTSSVTITEPAKSQYFFSNNQAPSFYSNRANLPAIFTNQARFDPVNDIVYLENSEVKYGINLKRGGQLCYASLAGSTDNLIFNGDDGGLQVQLDASQILDPLRFRGQDSGSPQNNSSYNTTMGGTHLNQSQTLIDYRRVGTSGYYVKLRPLLYPFDALISETEIEVTYTLIGRALKIEYNYVSFRTDGQFPINPVAPGGFKGWAVPVCFLVEKLNRYQTYVGSSPWTNSAVEDGGIPNSTPGQNGGPIMGRGTKEYWGLSYNQNDNVGFGALNISEGGTEGYMTWEQREKYAGNPQGSVFGNGGRTVMDILTNVLVPNGANFQKSTTAYIAVGSPSQIRQSFYANTGH